MFLDFNLLLLAATLMHPPAAQTSIHVVNGVLGKPVNFVTNASLEGIVEAIDWDFQAETGPLLVLAELKNGEIKRANPEDRFRQRLEIINKTMLRIKDLEVEDGGEYTFRVKFPLGKLYIQKFQLNIFVFHTFLTDPVPQPQIHPEQVSQTLHACNVTLKCLASGKGRFSISWEAGNPLKGLEEGLDWYQLSSNGSDRKLRFWDYHRRKRLVV
nr:uncharacterized protein LOC110081537 [Pogona vitticeps]